MRRPSSLFGLLARLLYLHRRRVALGAVALAVGVVALFAALSGGDSAQRAPLRVASFNIEYFPKHDRQVDGAFREIAALDVSAIGLQEITAPKRFAREARARLGQSWRFVHQKTGGGHRNRLHLGVAFDEQVFELLDARSRRETQVDNRTQASFQVRLEERASGRTVTLLVAHLKAMSDGRPTRARQYAGLEAIVRDIRSSDSNLVVMGDFNATEPDDRVDLARLADRTDLVWATETLPCSAFWKRDSDCPTSRLDHALSWTRPTAVKAHGGCADG